MKTRKLISLCLILALLAALLCLPAAAAEVSDWDALSAALATGGAVKLAADVTAPAARTRILEVPAGVTATLDLNGFTLDGGTPGEEDCVILVHGSFTLTDSSAGGTGRITGTRDAVDVLGGDFTMTGGTMDGCGNDGVAAAEGGSFTMTGGAVRGSGQIGVYVTGEGSAATISGGEISGSVGFYEDDWFYHGTGLNVEYGAVAEIAGGVISGNVFGVKVIDAALLLSGGEVRDNDTVPLGDEDTYGGAGLYAYQGLLRMTGGTVSDNSFAGLYIDIGSQAEVSGGTLSGGGECAILLLDGMLHMSGGEITGCEKRGIWVSGGAGTMTDGRIADCGAFGVQIDAGSFELSGGEIADSGRSGMGLGGEDAFCRMTGGTISGSRGEMLVEEDWYLGGDGVEVLAGSFEMTGGEMRGNVNGIEVEGGSAVMRGGVIRDSYIGYAPYGTDFGGCGVTMNAGRFEMTGGELRDNESLGVFVCMLGSAAVSGGTISGNGYCGLQIEGGTLELSGSPVFADNRLSDLALANGMTLTVAGPLALEKPLTVGSYDLGDYQGEEAAVTTGLPGNGSAEDFVYASPTYEIVTGADGEAKAAYIRYFPDVTNTDWYAASVAYAASKGIFEGTDKGFEPELKMTNAMAVQALWNHALRPDADAALPSGDADAWYADALRWALETGIADAGSAPDASITREGFALLCYRYMQTLGQGFQGLWSFRLDFTDAGAVSEDALEAVSWCVMNGILIGMGDGTLAPRGVLTRAQAATVLMRLFMYIG